MNSKQKILNNLRNNSFVDNVELNISLLSDVFYENKNNLIDLFTSEIEKADGEVVLVKNSTNKINEVLEYLRKENLNKIYTFISDFKGLNIEGLNISSEFNKNIEVAITDCEYLSARTGTIVVSSNEIGRKINYFAPIHIVLAKKSQIVNDIDEVLEKITKKYDELPSAISFITGPSRTADIEKTLIIGAHGPKRLIVFIDNEF